MALAERTRKIDLGSRGCVQVDAGTVCLLLRGRQSGITVRLGWMEAMALAGAVMDMAVLLKEEQQGVPNGPR